MAYLLPISTDPLNSPDHSLLHRIITVDSAAAEQSLKIDSSSNAILLGGVSVDTSFTGKQIATPSNPAASYNKIYFKSDERLYLLTSGGTESLVGNISGSTGATDNAILRADGTGGKTLQTTGITIDDSDNIVLPTLVANDQKGILYRGSVRWLHSYYPTNAGGLNIFLGQNAGNFTMTADVGESWEASNLIGIGPSTLSGITQGYLLIAIGNSAYAAVTTGSAGTALGHFSFQRNTSAAGTALGYAAGRYVVGYANTPVGISSGQGVDGSSTYGYTTTIGAFSGLALTTPNFNTFIGTYSGSNVTTGASNIIISATSLQSSAATLISGSSNIIIGNANSMALSSTSVSNEMNIANVFYAVGLYGTGKFGIGVTNANITARLHIAAGSTAANSAPLKFTSGSLQSTAEAGAMEFLTDAYYLTITTDAARQQIVTDTNTVTMTNKTLTAPRFANGGFIADANGNEIILFTTTASAVNQLTLANAATGSFPVLYSSGDDTNVSLGFSSKGTGNINFYSGSATRVLLQLVDTASSVNYFRFTPAVTTANPILSAVGTDSNIGLDFQTKGTGTYRLLGTSSQAAELRLYEDTDDGTNYTAFKTGTQAGNITYTLPTTAPSVDGQVLSATTGGVMSWATPSATGFTSRIRVKRSTTQSINDTTFTKVQFDSEDYDSLNEFDSSTNYRFTVTTTGYYLIHANLEYSSLSDGKMIRVAIYKNGTKVGRERVAITGVSADLSVSATDILSLAATDYIEIFAYHDQGVARDLKADSFLSIHRLS